MSANREQRIIDLCHQAAACEEVEEFRKLVAELHTALREHTLRARNRWAQALFSSPNPPSGVPNQSKITSR